MEKILFLLGELSDDDLDWLITRGQIEQVVPGNFLIGQGEPIDCLYILLEGKVAVSVADSDGLQEIAVLGSGEVFGEISFLDGGLPSANVEALEDCLVLSIGREELSARLRQDMGFACRFYRGISLFLSSRLRMRFKGRDYEKDYLPPEQELGEQDFAPAFVERLPLAKTRFDWLLRRVKNLRESAPG